MDEITVDRFLKRFLIIILSTNSTASFEFLVALKYRWFTKRNVAEKVAYRFCFHNKDYILFEFFSKLIFFCFYVKGQKKEGSRSFTMIYRSMWKLAKGKKIEVAMKILKKEFSDNHLKEFLEMAGQYAHLHSTAIVRFFGITLSSNVSLVMEYFRLGPLNIYLREHRKKIKTVDLIEAASNVASALWHLVSLC